MVVVIYIRIECGVDFKNYDIILVVYMEDLIYGYLKNF